MGAIVAANYSVALFGPSVSPINAFLLIGLDLSLRDKIHDKYGFGFAAILTVIAAAVSYWLNPAAGMIAVASAISFLIANLADGSIYQALTNRTPLIKMNGSNTAGALVDSIVFPTIAFGSIMPEIMLLQFIAKVVGGALWSWPLSRKGFINKVVR